MFADIYDAYCFFSSSKSFPNDLNLSLSLFSGSDGLVKLWTIKTNECVKTFDAHQDKVWALHGSRKDDLIVTGSADSLITFWKVSPPDISCAVSLSSDMCSNHLSTKHWNVKWNNANCVLCYMFAHVKEAIINVSVSKRKRPLFYAVALLFIINTFDFLIPGFLCTAVQAFILLC